MNGMKHLSASDLRAAKNGDEQALAVVVASALPVIRHMAAAAAVPGLDHDDVVQEGLVGLFGALQTYRKDGGAGFATYAAACIQNAIASAQKSAGRKKHQLLSRSLPLADDALSPSPEDAVIASEQVASVLNRARSVLSPFEKEVLLLYLDGYPLRDIAAKLGKTPKSAGNALSRVRRKLK